MSTSQAVKNARLLRQVRMMAGLYDGYEGEVPESKNLRDLTRALDSNGRERHRKQGRVLALVVAVPASVVMIVYTCIGLSLVQGSMIVAQGATENGFTAAYQHVGHTFWEFAAPLGFAGLCAVVTILGLRLNWVLRPKHDDFVIMEANAWNWTWGGIVLVALIIGSLAAVLSTTGYTNGAMNELVNNWLVTNQRVSSDTDYAGQAETSRDFLTRNVDGRWVSFTISRDGYSTHVEMHDAPQGAQ